MSERPAVSRSGSETRQRGLMVSIRVTAAELAELEGGAERAGLTVASYIRGRLLTAPETRARRRPTIERELAAQAVALMGRCSGSLHQIAKRLNFGDVEYADQVPAALAELKKAVAVVLSAAGYEGDGKAAPDGRQGEAAP
jgi:hypothetical protein